MLTISPFDDKKCSKLATLFPLQKLGNTNQLAMSAFRQNAFQVMQRMEEVHLS